MRRIPLRRRDGTVRAYALVDDEDYEWLNRWRWSLSGKGGHVRRGTRERGRYVHVTMHGQIMGAKHVDHIDGNGRNNRRSNLRICLNGQRDNMQNRGPNLNRNLPRGVAWHKAARKWRARVSLDGYDHHLGLFETMEEANGVASAFRAKHMPFSGDARAA